MNIITVYVSGGCVQDVAGIPPQTEVEILDYDTDGRADLPGHVETEDGIAQRFCFENNDPEPLREAAMAVLLFLDAAPKDYSNSLQTQIREKLRAALTRETHGLNPSQLATI